jgi:hypothetical protein
VATVSHATGGCWCQKPHPRHQAAPSELIAGFTTAGEVLSHPTKDNEAHLVALEPKLAADGQTISAYVVSQCAATDRAFAHARTSQAAAGGHTLLIVASQGPLWIASWIVHKAGLTRE